MSTLNESFTSFAYLVAAVLFIMALRGLSSPESSRKGNLFGMLGMLIAVVTTVLSPAVTSYGWILSALAIGAVDRARTGFEQEIARTRIHSEALERRTHLGPERLGLGPVAPRQRADLRGCLDSQRAERCSGGHLQRDGR